MRRVAGNVLAHELHAVAHEHDGVERGAPARGSHGCVRGHAVEVELGRYHGQLAAVADGVAGAGMPVQHHVNVAERAVAYHVHLARAALFGRSAVVTQRSLDVVGLHVLLERDGRQRCARAEQVVSATVAGGTCFHRIARGHGLLRESGQRVELAEDADDRLA